MFFTKNNDEVLLVDTGEGSEIVKRLKESNIELKIFTIYLFLIAIQTTFLN